MLHVLLEDKLSGIVDLRLDRGELDQDICAVLSFLHHAAHLVQMADRPLEPVYDRAHLMRIMCMAVIVVVPVLMGMRVRVLLFVRMDVCMLPFVCMDVRMFPFVRMDVCVLFRISHFLSFPQI